MTSTITRMGVRAVAFWGALLLAGVTVALAGGRFLPESDLIAYDYRGDIYLIDVDRALTYRLLGSPEDIETLPVWSPDGSQLAYLHNREQIRVMDMQTGEHRNISQVQVATFPEPVTWSPDGRQIAASGRDADTRRIALYLIDVRTGAMQTLLPSFAASEIRWSPDGTYLLFRSPGDVIYTAEVASGTLLAHTPSRGGFSPSWTEDSMNILFASRREGNYDIYQTPTGSDQHRRLTIDPAMDFTSYGLSNYDDVVLFVSHRDNDPEIYSLHIATNTLSRLTTETGSDWLPRWSPDGSRIVFVSSRSGNPNLYVMNPDGTGQRRISVDGWMDSSVIPEWRPR